MSADLTQHPLRTYGLVYGFLMLALAATVVAAYVPLGEMNVVTALSIAVVKALLVGWYFMHLRASRPIVSLFALAGVFWLALLMILTASDYLTRS